MKWIKTENKLPENQPRKSRRYYMAYSPSFTGYVFKCWYRDGFGANGPQSMISDVTHYRPARRGETDRQLTDEELAEI